MDPQGAVSFALNKKIEVAKVNAFMCVSQVYSVVFLA